MWTKIKQKLPLIKIWAVIGVIGCLFYLNHQTDKQLKEMIDQLGIETSHNRIDIIQLNTADAGIQSTVDFKIIQMKVSNKEFKEETMKDINHELGLVDSKLDRLEQLVERYSSDNILLEELVRKETYKISTVVDTLHIDTDKGTKSLQKQFDQLRLEFDELIQRLKQHTRTKGIFNEDV